MCVARVDAAHTYANMDGLGYLAHKKSKTLIREQHPLGAPKTLNPEPYTIDQVCMTTDV